MNDIDRLEEIRKRVNANEYLANAVADLGFLLELVDKLRMKNELLNQRNLELIQEMENIRADFGNDR
jgi:hypothetical protein